VYEKDLGNLYFQSSGRLVKLLGRESVSNPNVAILELIKNSYDADATRVTITFENVKTQHGKIVVEDNGQGMTRENIQKNWMNPGTVNKEDQPYSSKFHRRKIGEKGIARFGLDSLARYVLLESRVRGNEETYRLRIDWDQYLTSDTLFEKVANKLAAVPKRSGLQGLRIEINELREKWDDQRMLALRHDIELLLPPVARIQNFDVHVVAPEFPAFTGKVRPSFLKEAVYFFWSRLERDGTIRFTMKSRHKQERRWTERMQNLSCGPADLHLWFYYRVKSEYDDSTHYNRVMDCLKLWSGIKLYRDGLKVKPYGDSGNDWIGLDKLRVNDPSVFPGNAQVFGYVTITRQDNPDLIDITTRESLVSNPAYRDFLRYLQNSIRAFAVARKVIEGKRGRKRPRRAVRAAEPVPTKVEAVRETLLDFGRSYPEVFYRRLEDEINECYVNGLPNATLMLSRKLVENLVFNILETKYSRHRPLWWDTDHNRPRDFGRLLDTLSLKAGEFEQDQRQLLKRLLDLIGPFRREANLKTHYLMSYLEGKDELGSLKIPEIAQISIKLFDKVKATK
jgi:hypothetical protein